ncbi:Hypothetical predicted protein [Olea europaea subsp. europaea]|uniref:Uncharacterized protein n=1 Tax=Olea europaea subsp. europaea TaxID=158383 RepID=A0A8S0TGY8_OLEEU|nr:Hypothetical predicted protein [Olea europaea subsp. europaea]
MSQIAPNQSGPGRAGRRQCVCGAAPPASAQATLAGQHTRVTRLGPPSDALALADALRRARWGKTRPPIIAQAARPRANRNAN